MFRIGSLSVWMHLAGVSLVVGAFVSFGRASPPPCLYTNRCFYSNCVNVSATGARYRFYDDCTIDDVTREQAHTGSTSQNRSSSVTHDEKVDYWSVSTGGSRVCESTTYPVEANCSKPDKERSGDTYCNTCTGDS